jgi:ergothioneine biosynthesis protein EgtB
MTTIPLRGDSLHRLERYRRVRQRTLALCEPLTAEDMMVQSCPEASPSKWHLAHTAWFFESFVLRDFLAGYRLFNSDYPWLFNSYYRSFAEFPEKRLRASFSRPGLDEVLSYRKHVDGAVERLLCGDTNPEAVRRIELGIHHEEQHQELLLTDILHAFSTNPLRPPYLPGGLDAAPGARRQGLIGDIPAPEMGFVEFTGGLREAGYAGTGFCYDNELPRHRIWLDSFAMANRLVTCGEFAAFIADDGYLRPELWLSAGWDAVTANHWRAPLYWSGEDDETKIFTLRGEAPLIRLAHAPVSHVSFFEADAYARWAGYRLASELEWEVAAAAQPVRGNLLGTERLLPAPWGLVAAIGPGRREAGNAPAGDGGEPPEEIAQVYGDCWEWTSSAYLGYPGFKAPEGALGEYNGKFMSGQMVLRGGSCVTPEEHIRVSYRNFFAPETRWQFSGIRLAR